MLTKSTTAVLVAATGALAGTAHAQNSPPQKVTGPEAVYWISAETQSGLVGMPPMPGFDAMATGPDGMPRMPTPADYAQPDLKGQLGVAAGETAAQAAGSNIGGIEGEAVARIGGLLARGLGGRGKKKPAAQPVAAAPEPEPEPTFAAAYTHNLTLQLGSSRKTAAPAADHFVPAALRAGASLPLKTAKVSAPAPVTGVFRPEDPVRPRGKMTIYWGCGEKAAAPPIVIDLAKLGAKAMQSLPSLPVRLDIAPSEGRHATFGDWPNDQDVSLVRAGSSLVGEHAVRGSYSPEIRFALNGTQDFLAPLEISGPAPTPTGGARLTWKAIPHAAGYFAQAIGSPGDESMVFWASSAKAVGFGQLMSYLPESEVRRLVADKVVLAPTVTECVIPAEVVKAIDSGMVQMIAYGEEANFVDPPRPTDPKVAWDRSWTVKLRRKSTAAALLGANE